MTPPTLNMVMAQINKTANETVVQRLGKMERIDTERISTGVKKLDDALGGGFPIGRMVEMFGLPASGKSLIAQLVIAQAQKKGGELITPPEGFYVEGTEGPLVQGELERAESWAKKIGLEMQTIPTQRRS